MRNLTGLFRNKQAARVAVSALREAGFSSAIIDRPETKTNLKRHQEIYGGRKLANELADVAELVPVHLQVVYPYSDTVERIMLKKGALSVRTQANAPYA